MIANYHTHTFRCGHAGGTDREYVEAAIAGGFRILGFSDHSPQPLPEDGCGMQMEDLEEYVASIQALKREYQNDITIYVGLEVENSPAHFEELLNFLSGYPLDYLILGQHAVFGIPGFKVAFQRTTNPAVFNNYCDQAKEAMVRGVFSYWAHPDVIYFEGNGALYEKRMRELCRIARDNHLPLEINFNGIIWGRNYPNPAFWKIAGEEKCQVILGCDAHSPQQILEAPEPLEKALELVERYDLRLLETIPLKKPFPKR